MTIHSKVTLTIRKFLKKYGKFIFIVFIVWGLIILLNTYLKNKPKELIASNTYKPDVPIIEYGGEVPKKEKQEVNETLEKYIEYCKNKNYQEAFDMLTKDCKEYIYHNKIENFQIYVDNIFGTYNSYSYNQNYSNVDGIYIYDVTILNKDILSTGTTGGYDKYKEKISILEEDGVKKISNQSYIKNENIGIQAEDEYMKIKIVSKDNSYDKVSYNLEITNKVDYDIVLSDSKAANEVSLNIGGNIQNANNLMLVKGIVRAGETIRIPYIFDRFYDDNSEDLEIRFNYIRILDNYTEEMPIEEQEQKAYKLYSYNIGIE